MKLRAIVVSILLAVPLADYAGTQQSKSKSAEGAAAELSTPNNPKMGGQCPGIAKITLGPPKAPADAPKGAPIFLKVGKLPPIAANLPYPEWDKAKNGFPIEFDLSKIRPDQAEQFCGHQVKLYYNDKDGLPSKAVLVTLPRQRTVPRPKITVTTTPMEIECEKPTDVTIQAPVEDIASLGELRIGGQIATPVSSNSAKATGVQVLCSGPEKLTVTASQADQSVSLPILKIKRPEKSVQAQIAELKSAIRDLNTNIDNLQKKIQDVSVDAKRRMFREVVTDVIVILLIGCAVACWWIYQKRLQPKIKDLQMLNERVDGLDKRFEDFKNKIKIPLPATTSTGASESQPTYKEEVNTVVPAGNLQDVPTGGGNGVAEIDLAEDSGSFSYDRFVRDYNNALEDTSQHDKFIKRYQAHRIAIKNQVEVTRSSSTPVFSEDEKGDLYAIPYNHLNYVVPALDRMWTGDTVRVWDSSFEIREASSRRLTSPAEAVQQADGWRIAKKGKLERVP